MMELLKRIEIIDKIIDGRFEATDIQIKLSNLVNLEKKISSSSWYFRLDVVPPIAEG